MPGFEIYVCDTIRHHGMKGSTTFLFLLDCYALVAHLALSPAGRPDMSLARLGSVRYSTRHR